MLSRKVLGGGSYCIGKGTHQKKGGIGVAFEPAVRRGVAGGVDKDFLDRRGLVQSLSVTCQISQVTQGANFPIRLPGIL